jgi:hypothetical protein
MLTLKFNDEDMPFVLAALRMRANALIESVVVQIDIQRNVPPPPQEFSAEAPPVEATITPKRSRGRPKGRKDTVKRRVAKRGAAK